MYDQPYWDKRAGRLRIGIAHAQGAPTTASLTEALERSFNPDIVDRARLTAAAVRIDGALIAAQRVVNSGRHRAS